jgi:hypothetical protein
MSVTRAEIADHVQDAFDGERLLTADDLLASARRNRARAAVLRSLERLPGKYIDLRDLWPDLPGVPVGV